MISGFLSVWPSAYELGRILGFVAGVGLIVFSAQVVWICYLRCIDGKWFWETK